MSHEQRQSLLCRRNPSSSKRFGSNTKKSICSINMKQTTKAAAAAAAAAATASSRPRNTRNDSRQRIASWSEFMSFVFGCGPGIGILLAIGMLGAVFDGLVYPLNAYLFSLIISQLSGTSSNGMQAVQETAILFVLAGFISVTAACIHTTSLYIVAYHASKAFRLQWIQSLLRQDAAFFDVYDDTSGAGLATQISSTVKTYRQGIGEKLGNCVKYACIGIGCLAFALISSWRVTLAVLTILPIVAMASMALVHYNQTTSQRSALAYRKAASIAYSSVANIRTVHSLNAVPEMIRQYAIATQEAYRKMTSYLVKIGVAKGSVQGSFMLMYIVLTMYGSHLLYSELAETGCDPSGNVLDNPSCNQTGQELFNALIGVAFTGLGLAQLAACLEGITQARVAAYQALATINRKPGAARQVIYHDDHNRAAAVAASSSSDTDSVSRSTRDNDHKFWAEDDEREDSANFSHDNNVKAILPKYEINSTAKDGLKPKHIEGSISFKNVYFSYPTRPGVNVFRGLSTEIKAGETVAFVGPSGGG
jgi:ATP-binding cassette, subfamily B (MDR/TAP), member 1